MPANDTDVVDHFLEQSFNRYTTNKMKKAAV